MKTHPITGAHDPVKANRDYRALGPMTDADLRYLDRLPDVGRKRTAVKNWFGAHGGRLAWMRYVAHCARSGRTP